MGQEKPTCYYQVSQKVNIWCGILRPHIIGPYFSEGNLSGQTYFQFLQDIVILELNALQLNYSVIFMYNGCPAHGNLVSYQYVSHKMDSSM